MRTRRAQCEADIYHIMARGVGRQIIFEDDEDRSYFIELLSRFCAQQEVTVYAWCLMDNHVHLLLGSSIAQVGTLMRNVESTYALRYNRRHDHIGHLFQGRFKSEPIRTDEQMLATVRYIHKNPEKANLGLASDYRWCSYREYCGKAILCDTSLVLGLLGSREAFEAFHRSDEENLPRPPLDTSLRFAGENRIRSIAEQSIGAESLARIGTLPKPERDNLLAEMRSAGLSIRQIERLTGIGRNIIQRATTAK